MARRDPEKARANRRADYHRHQEERRVAQRAYRATEGGKAAVRAASATWAERNPEKRKAQWAVNNAVRDGKLSKAPCEVCGEEEVDGHHDDYSKPLEVRWLCRVHHQAAHA